MNYDCKIVDISLSFADIRPTVIFRFLVVYCLLGVLDIMKLLNNTNEVVTSTDVSNIEDREHILRYSLMASGAIILIMTVVLIKMTCIISR